MTTNPSSADGTPASGTGTTRSPPPPPLPSPTTLLPTPPRPSSVPPPPRQPLFPPKQPQPPKTKPPPPPPHRPSKGTTHTHRSTIVLDGVPIVVNLVDPNKVVQSTRVSKHDRYSLDAKELRQFEESVIKKVHPRYSLLAPPTGDTKDSDSQLKESMGLYQLIESTQSAHRRHDIDDVWSIIFPVDIAAGPSLELDPVSGGPRKMSLYKEYVNLTQLQVATSCYWYRMWPSQSTCPYFQDNLRLGFEFMEKHTDLRLHQKVMETYSKYDSVYQGGPLYFKILIDLLVTNTEHMAESIIANITNFRISSLQGENVSTAVSMLKANCESLYHIKRLPSDIEVRLLRVYQTTSVPEFNSVFKSQYDARQYALLNPFQATVLPGTFSLQTYGAVDQTRLYQLCETLHGTAQNLYTQLRPTWDVPSKPSTTGFTATSPSTSKPDASSSSRSNASPSPRAVTFKASALLSGVCWNCGSDQHLLSNCDKPRNEKQIELNRQAFRRARDSSGSSTGSSPSPWAPPKEGESNKKVIKGRPMFYNRRAKRWVPDRSDSTQAQVSSDSTSSTVSNASTPPDDTTDSISHRQVLLNITQYLAKELRCTSA